MKKKTLNKYSNFKINFNNYQYKKNQLLFNNMKYNKFSKKDHEVVRERKSFSPLEKKIYSIPENPDLFKIII